MNFEVTFRGTVPNLWVNKGCGPDCGETESTKASTELSARYESCLALGLLRPRITSGEHRAKEFLARSVTGHR